MNIGLFFGSFNPVHIGHLVIANYILEFTEVEKIWFIVSPQNPFKKNSSLFDDSTRLQWLKESIGRNENYEVKDFEFHLPKPSYTINTLNYLQQNFPSNKFTIIMGEDSLQLLHKWKDYKKIINNYKIYIYPRKILMDATITMQHSNIKRVDAPIIEISSTFIREALKQGKNVEHFLPKGLINQVKTVI